VIILIGLQFRSSVEHDQDAIVGSLLIATGIGFVLFELSGRGHGHDHDHDHDYSSADPHDHQHESSGPRGLIAVMVPFGAAASPDLTILPVFLAATTAGVGAAVGSLITFAAVTIATIVALTLLATFGGYQVRGGWLDRGGNMFTAAVLVVIGALVLAGVL
jgi:nickel/cobalt transporter (NicO) family protein